MTYDEWKELIKTQHDPDYYTNLVKYAPQIVEQLEEYKQHVVAKQLNLAGPKLSVYTPILKALARNTK